MHAGGGNEIYVKDNCHTCYDVTQVFRPLDIEGNLRVCRDVFRRCNAPPPRSVIEIQAGLLNFEGRWPGHESILRNPSPKYDFQIFFILEERFIEMEAIERSLRELSLG